MKKKILIINTGGTISSVQTQRGYEPQQGYVKEALKTLPALTHQAMPAFDIKEYTPLLDSSNMTLSDWNRIGEDIKTHYDAYDGFVIFHGTDTMAYTASALSFMLEHLSKPVILTGSQIPLSEVRNDAADNVITSLWLSAHQPVNEVCVYFNGQYLRGNRAQKISAQQFGAFVSPNYPPLATIGIHIDVHRELLLDAPTKPFHFQPISPHFIANFRLFPGFATEVLEYLLKQPLEGLILETYGAGNAQNQDQRFLDLLKEATRRGVVIINCTQCHQGRVEMDQYATGHALKQAGVVSGHDMTPEAAHCKLLYLLSKGLSPTAIKAAVEAAVCGELSVL